MCDEADDYPFAGYKEVLNAIYNVVRDRDSASVLDIGFGTGTLTAKLYEHGCRITGVDFSPKMMRIASAKMPDARLFQADFSKGLPREITSENFDFILATYSLHHLTDDEKIPFIECLLERLNEDGLLMIGDIAFGNRALLDACKAECKGGWDDGEFYFVYDELKDHFGDRVSFHKFSFCAGVLAIVK